MPVFTLRAKKHGKPPILAPTAEAPSTTLFTPQLVKERSGLHFLHDCPSTLTSAVDIVAVHGLGGRWYTTWTSNGKTWLQDFLPEQLMEVGIPVRVMAFGYDSDTAFTKAVTDVGDVAGMLLDRLHNERQTVAEKSRPVIFIAHSLGGIVVKKLMILAREQSAVYGSLLDRIHGVVFLGVPHQGSDVAYWGAFAAQLLKFAQLGFGTNTAYVESLKRNSPTFAVISAQFKEQAGALPVRTFFETEKYKGQLVVDKVSATMGLPTEVVVGLAGSNHRTMCKFDYREGQRYRPVWQAVQALAQNALAMNSPQSLGVLTTTPTNVVDVPPNSCQTTAVRPVKQVFPIPYPRDTQFVHRTEMFSQIEDGLKHDRPVALCGMGGVGKSQIAIEYAYRYRDAYPQGQVFWIYVANFARFAASYRTLARKLGLAGCDDPKLDVCELVRDWLNDEDSGPWLIILDNADNEVDFLPKVRETCDESSALQNVVSLYLPTAFHSSRQLLITTRSPNVGEYLSHGHPCVSVGALKQGEATNLLLTKLRTTDIDEYDAHQLVEILGFNALAVSQAAAYVRKTKISLRQYITALQADSQNMMDHLSCELQDPDPRREPGFPNSVFRTWKLTFDQLLEHHPRAAELLSLMAMLDGQNIPLDKVRATEDKIVDFHIAVGTLDAYSMITKVAEGDFCAMHPLVQASVHYFLDQEGKIGLYRSQALLLISNLFPAGQHEVRDEREALLPHAQAVTKWAPTSDDDQDNRYSLLYNMGMLYRTQGKHKSAYTMLSESYQSCEALYGERDIDTMTIQGMIAETLRVLGNYEESALKTRELLKLMEEVLGREHRETLVIMIDLALILDCQGKYQDAESIYREVYLRQQQRAGEESFEIYITMSNLAHALILQAKYEEARVLLEDALSQSEEALGLEHPYTIEMMGHLAQTLMLQGKYDEAEVLDQRVLILRRKVLGEEHPETLMAGQNLAALRVRQGRYDEALELFKQSLQPYQKVFGMEHPNTIGGLHNFASLRVLQGKYEEAEVLFLEVVHLRSQTLGKEHCQYLRSVWALGSLYFKMGNLEQSRIYFDEALPGLENTLGPDHPSAVACREQYEDIFGERGKPVVVVAATAATAGTGDSSSDPVPPPVNVMAMDDSILSSYEIVPSLDGR